MLDLHKRWDTGKGMLAARSTLKGCVVQHLYNRNFIMSVYILIHFEITSV